MICVFHISSSHLVSMIIKNRRCDVSVFQASGGDRQSLGIKTTVLICEMGDLCR